MENKVKFALILAIVVILAGITLFVYQDKYGDISMSGFAINDSGGEVKWPLIALMAQWLILLLALFIAAINYLKPKK